MRTRAGFRGRTAADKPDSNALPWRRKLLLFASASCGPGPYLAVMLLAAAQLAMFACPAIAQNTRVGGPCAYSDCPGSATIVSVEPVPHSGGDWAGLPYQPYRVRFTFSPAKPVPHRLYVQDKLHELTLSGGTPPGPKFLKKYAITPGASFTAELRLIESGTCSPVVFTFPGVDLSDHFELTTP